MVAIRRGQWNGASKLSTDTNKMFDCGTPVGAMRRGTAGSGVGCQYPGTQRRGRDDEHGTVNSSSPSTISTFSSFSDKSKSFFSSRTRSMVNAVFGSSGSAADASRFVSARNAANVYIASCQQLFFRSSSSFSFSFSSSSFFTQQHIHTHTPVNRDLVVAI